MYRVIKRFKDLQDNRYAYYVGDLFPHKGLKVGKRRIEELATDKNILKTPLIEEVREENVDGTLPGTEKLV